MANPHAIIGVSDHGGWAVLVSLAVDGTLLDKRRVDLVDADLPCLPHHCEGQLLPPDEAVALVERVRASAERQAAAALAELEAALPMPVGAIALRALQPLPPTIQERLTNYRARNVADWVMYRTALAEAAEARGWAVYWYDARKVLAPEGLEDHLTAVGRASGKPWTKDHKLAMAAAIAASHTKQA